MVQFNSLESVLAIEEAAALAEIQAMISGVFRVSEMPFDRDLLSESYIEFVRQRGEPWDDPDYLAQEPETCFANAMHHISADIITRISEQAEMLGEHYPIDISRITEGILVRKDEPSAVGVSYVWLQFYLLTKSSANVVQFDDVAERKWDRESVKFEYVFAKVFEYIALFAVSGKYQGESWITAPLRSAADYLEMLASVCAFANHGGVRSYEQLAANEKTTNDGRNDVLHMTTVNGVPDADAELYLVQATIQKGNLQQKVVKENHKTFFNNFFLSRLQMPKHGVLAVPHVKTEHLQSECELENCVYLPLHRLLPHMGQSVLAGNAAIIAEAFEATFGDISNHLELQVF